MSSSLWRRLWVLGMCLVVLGRAPDAWASPEWESVGEDPSFEAGPAPADAPGSAGSGDWRRRQAIIERWGVLHGLKVPSLSTALLDQPPYSGFAAWQSESGARAIAKVLFPQGLPSERLRLSKSELTLPIEAWRAPLRGNSTPIAPHNARMRELEHAALALDSASEPTSRPLTGLRVALDPGHFGEAGRWEGVEKYVVDCATGDRLYESVIALQTAQLLAERLIEMGADVHLSRGSLEPLAKGTPETIPAQQIVLGRLWSDIGSNWLTQYASRTAHWTLDAAAQGLTEERGFRQLQQFDDSERNKAFNLNDLEARVRSIEAFGPHVTLIIHYDTGVVRDRNTATGPNCPKAFRTGEITSSTKVYVPGGLSPDVLTLSSSRERVARWLLDPQAWRASRALARGVVGALSQGLALPRSTWGCKDAVALEPGVFGCSWYLSRRLGGHAVVYIETLHYNSTEEFARMSPHQSPTAGATLIEGRAYPYTERLERASESIAQGLLAGLRDLRSSLAEARLANRPSVRAGASKASASKARRGRR